MGLLQEQNLPTLFQGVSRQPESIRLPGQVEDALNVTFSVESGGFSKRNGTTIETEVAAQVAAKHKMHLISRSQTEKYAMVHLQQNDGTGELKVFDISTGQQKTVTIEDAGDATFFDTDPKNLEFLTVVDYTFVINKDDTVQMLPAPAPDPNTYAVLQLTKANTDGTYKVTIKYDDPANPGTQKEIVGDDVAVADDEPDKVTPVVEYGLTNNAPDGEGWEFIQESSFIFIRNTQGIEFTIETEDPLGDDGWKKTAQRVSKPEELVARSWRGHKVEIRKATEEEGYWLEFFPEDPLADYGEGTWDETVPDGTKVDFDPATMPRALVRQQDGSFQLERIEWEPKTAGGEELVPPPEFVGQKISDIVFRSDRLGLLAGETVFFSAAGDYFRFWPDSATQLVATDPFGLANSTNQVSNFKYGVPFRRSLFIMSDEAQFEAYGDVFSPDEARIDVATQYPANGNVRPVVLGDEMYFVSEIGKDVLLHSYIYNDETVSEIANDVSKHVRGFVEGPIIGMAAGTLNGEVFLLSAADQSQVYIHKFFYEGRDRVMSSWGRYEFPNSTVHSIGYQLGNLYLLIERSDGKLYLESLPSVESASQEFEIQPRLDRMKHVLGTYDSGTDTTTWETGVEYTNPVVLTTLLFPEGKKFLNLNVSQSGTQLTASGDWSQSEVVVGEEYDSFVQLSKQYLRDGEAAIVNGRLQLRTMTLRFEDTGYFEVEVTPEFRETKRHVFTGRVIGSGNNQVQAFNLSSGRFKFLVNSNAETVKIRIGSSKFLPFTITSGAWVGFFNEISRQDNT